MSGECDKCGEHTLECTCRSYSRRQENGRQHSYSLLNSQTIPLCEGIDPSAEQLPDRRTVDVRGREEHEAIIQDSAKCKELGLDQVYETIVYLNRWGGWLGQ